MDSVAYEHVTYSSAYTDGEEHRGMDTIVVRANVPSRSKAIGTLSIDIEREDDEAVAHVNNFEVETGYRGRHIGTGLACTALTELIARPDITHFCASLANERSMELCMRYARAFMGDGNDFTFDIGGGLSIGYQEAATMFTELRNQQRPSMQHPADELKMDGITFFIDLRPYRLMQQKST